MITRNSRNYTWTPRADIAKILGSLEPDTKKTIRFGADLIVKGSTIWRERLYKRVGILDNYVDPFVSLLVFSCLENGIEAKTVKPSPDKALAKSKQIGSIADDFGRRGRFSRTPDELFEVARGILEITDITLGVDSNPGKKMLDSARNRYAAEIISRADLSVNP